MLSLWFQLFMMAGLAIIAAPSTRSRRIAFPAVTAALVVALVQTSSTWHFYGSAWLALWVGWLGLCFSIRCFESTSSDHSHQQPSSSSHIPEAEEEDILLGEMRSAWASDAACDAVSASALRVA